MALSQQPKIVTDGLVFAYDMANSYKSWKGEPTTNLVPDPSNNGRFTTSNGWGTYNTNQYNSNTYFSIGTISSVSGNIVTTSAAHPLRTYDVVRPQTTGGGLTAGVNYTIKKISSTQFSVHSYNSSQNGSQGYIVPGGGYHKVHESIALNQQVPINSTSFPTMWWGPPHLPNSGLVKEIVAGAGPQGQNVMRLHVHRTDGVADGMAYGVYVPVTAGDVINVSYWQRTNYPGKNLGYSTYFGGNPAFGSNYAPADTEWHRVSYQWTASVTYNFYQYWWPDGSSDVPYWTDICDLQVEVNTQSGDTPFVDGTRSNTQAVVDLTGNNTVTASSLTYNSDGTFSFNGTSNYINTSVIGSHSSYTIEMWCKINGTTGTQQRIFSSSSGGTHCINTTPPGQFGFHYNPLDGSPSSTGAYTGVSVDYNIWYHIVATNDSTNSTSGAKIYLNGELKGSQEPAITLNGNVYFGSDRTVSLFSNSTISIAKIYNRALTADEVQQNFNALRGRYGI